MTRKRLTLVLSAVGVIALVVFIAVQFLGEYLPAPATSASASGYIVDDEMHEAMTGRFVFWLADCPTQPGSFNDLLTTCGNVRQVQVDEEVWWQYSRGDYFPGG